MAKNHEWQEGTVFDNVAAAVKAIGVTEPGIVWGIANVEWQSTKERDQFLAALSYRGPA